jgi:hypothetical protein
MERGPRSGRAREREREREEGMHRERGRVTQRGGGAGRGGRGEAQRGWGGPPGRRDKTATLKVLAAACGVGRGGRLLERPARPTAAWGGEAPVPRRPREHLRPVSLCARARDVLVYCVPARTCTQGGKHTPCVRLRAPARVAPNSTRALRACVHVRTRRGVRQTCGGARAAARWAYTCAHAGARRAYTRPRARRARACAYARRARRVRRADSEMCAPCVARRARCARRRRTRLRRAHAVA